MNSLLKEKARLAKHYGNYLERYVVKATSIKLKPLKPKHVDIITRATFEGEMSIDSIFHLIFTRMKEGNWVTAFKALILIHIMMREGNTDKVLNYLSSNLHYLNLSHYRDKTSSLDGNIQAKNIRAYAAYLEEKVIAYRELKHDMVKMKQELIPKFKTASYQNGGTLLSDVESLQKQLNALLGCTFYVEEIDNVMTMQAFRLSIGDAMALFHLLNEGVMRILTVYFEMERPQASQALEIYKMFAKITEKVVELFDIARKLRGALGIEVPIFKHVKRRAPISLAGGLEEYLNAPDFEAQRLELKMKKAQKASSNGDLSSKSLQQQQQPSASNNHGNAPKPPPVAPTQAPAKPVIDFFSSLDDEIGAFAAAPQNNMDVFNNIGTSAGFWAAGQQQQQAQSNPFGIMSHPQQQQFNNGGYIQPNYTGGNMNNNNSSNPFGMHHQQNQQIQQQFANRGGGSVSQQNNPFRASAPVMSLQNTGTAVGFNSFSSNNNQFTVENVFGNSGSVSPPPVNGNNTGITGIEAGDPAATFQQQSSSASLTSGPGNFATMDRIGTNTTGQMNGFGGGVGGGGGNFATFGRSSPTAPDFASLRSHATGSTNSSNSPFGAYVDPFAATSQFSSQINPAAPRSLNVGQSPSYPVSTGGKGNNNGLLFNPSSANNNNFAFTSSNNNINNNNNAFSPPTSPLVNANNYDNNNHFGSNFGGSMQPSSQASKLSPPLGNTTKSVNMGAPFNNNNNNLNIANYLPTTNGISSLKNQDVFATLNPLSSNAGQPSVTSGMSLNTLAAYNQQQLYSTPINNSGMTAYGGNAVNSPFGNNPGVNPFMMQNKMGAGGVDSNNPFGKSNVNNNQSNTFF